MARVKLFSWLSETPRLLLLAPAALAIGCAGPPFAAAVEGEPVCPDFEFGAGHVKMNGGLRFPVRMQLLEGKTMVMKLIIDGKRTADAPPSRTYFSDDNAEYTVEWAQCANERAPVPTTEPSKKAGHTPKAKEGAAYECGDAAVYKTEKLVTKKHDRESHKVTFVAPPKPECWVSDVPPAAVVDDAGAPDAAAPQATTDAGAEPADAGGAAAGDAGPAGDAGAAKDTKDDKSKPLAPKK